MRQDLINNNQQVPFTCLKVSILWYSHLQINPSFLQVVPHINQTENFYFIFTAVAP